MSFEEGDYVEVRDLPGLIWQIFEKSQIDTYTLNLRFKPNGWSPPPGKRFLFEAFKAGDHADENELIEPNSMEVLRLQIDDVQGENER